MHCTLCFFFLVPYLLLWFCVFNLSLSLSLSLLIMAPKKYDPSKNPICHDSSSFPYDFIQFRDKKAQDDFFENFSD